MRFEQLRLERFGHFADKTIDLRGDKIHLIHGPNASGKSTIRAAISQLLFGIEDRTTYDFRFEKSQLRRGAVVASQDEARRLDFVRYKRRIRPLTTREGADLDDDALVPLLGGIDERPFLDLFVLDQDSLRIGGDRMLSAEGDLGRSLFAASSGFGDLAEVQKALSDEISEIAVVGRKMRTSRLWQVETDYNESRTRQKAAGLRKNEWEDAKNALVAAEAQITALGEERRRIERERSALDRKLRVLPVLLRLDRERLEAEPLAGTPDLPDNFGERWRKAESELLRGASVKAGASAELERLRGERESLPADAGPLLGHAAMIEDLHQRVANIADQQEATTRLTRDVAQSNERLSDLIRELGLPSEPDIERLLAAIPTRSVCTRIEELIAEGGRIEAAIEAARQRQARARRSLDRDGTALEKLGDPGNPSEAEREHKVPIGLGNVRRATESAARQVEEARAAETTALARLTPWKGTAEELERMALPAPLVVAAASAKLAQHAEDERLAQKALGDVTAGLREIEDDLTLVAAAGEMPTAEAIEAARQAREACWGEVRDAGRAGRHLAETTAAEYEGLVQRADNLVDRHVEHRELPTLLRNQARAVAAVEQCGEKLKRILDENADEWTRWRAVWAEAGLDARSFANPEALKGWLDRVREATLAAAAVRTARQALDDTDRDERQARDAVLRAAALIGFPLDPKLDVDLLRQRAGVAIEAVRTRWDEARHLRTSLAGQNIELEEATAELNGRAQDLENWRTRWAENMPAIFQEATADAGGVRGILSAWGTIREEHTKRSAARHRLEGVIGGLQADQAAARGAIARLDSDCVTVLGLGGDWSTWPPRLYEALKLAREVAGSIDAADRALASAERAHRDALRTLELAEGACERLRAEAGLSPEVDVATLIGPAERKREIAARLTETERELVDAGEGMPEADLRAEIADDNPDSIRAEVAALRESAVLLDQPIQQASTDRLKADQHLRALEARTGFLSAALDADAAAAEVKELTRRWMSLRAAQIVLTRSVERYRKANEGPLLRRADEIFRAIVRDRLPDDFIGLEVDYDDPAKPTIIARRRDGTSCTVKKMSTGTRDQLWLSLRIAVLERRAHDVEAMPFLGDDLFDSSDEPRAAAMLTAVGELAGHTQVLLFTHHAHIADMAERALGSRVRVHRLETRMVEAA
jgi:chromosome segregation protein